MEQKEIAKKMLPVIKAIADGKTIQLHNGKEQKRYRPFKDCDEMIEHYHEKYKSAVGCDIYFPPLYKPNIWVREKDTERDSLIVEYVPYGVTLGGEIIGLQELFDNFTFLDGTPCGCRR